MQLCYHLHLNVVNKDLPAEALNGGGGIEGRCLSLISQFAQ